MRTCPPRTPHAFCPFRAGSLEWLPFGIAVTLGLGTEAQRGHYSCPGGPSSRAPCSVPAPKGSCAGRGCPFGAHMGVCGRVPGRSCCVPQPLPVLPPLPGNIWGGCSVCVSPPPLRPPGGRCQHSCGLWRAGLRNHIGSTGNLHCHAPLGFAQWPPGRVP